MKPTAKQLAMRDPALAAAMGIGPFTPGSNFGGEASSDNEMGDDVYEDPFTDDNFGPADYNDPFGVDDDAMGLDPDELLNW